MGLIEKVLVTKVKEVSSHCQAVGLCGVAGNCSADNFTLFNGHSQGLIFFQVAIAVGFIRDKIGICLAAPHP